MSLPTESSPLEESLIDLNNTLNKDQGIVNTSSAGRFLESPGSIDQQYQEYASTHLIQEDINRFIDDLVDGLNDPDEDRSIPGYIVGPFGYGKTSTAGKVWHELEQKENYVTTPPIYFDELQSLVDAVYGWLRYRFDSEDILEELSAIYDRHLETNIESIVEDTDISPGDQESIHDQLQKLAETGEINVTFTVNNLLSFLSEANTLVQEAGYDGLVVIADELQQFISNAPSDKKAYSQLRDIAKSIALGLREGDGLGLLFTMDDGLEADLNVNADDVLARLSEQNVKIDLRNVYDRKFPKRLWNSLAEKYEFEEQQYEVISEDALNAIGQICERGKPLSNGPRTVVDIFTLGIDHYFNNAETFDALALANAYYTGTVRYKGDHIKQGMTSAINADVINTEARRNFIKICGIFPRGVPDEILKNYTLRESRDEVKNDLHGQHIITHEEGYTLKRLEREDEDRGIKDEIFTQFYQRYDTTALHDDSAREIFQSQVLEEELFESTRGKGLNSWVTRNEFSAHTGGVYKAKFEGSFDGDNYPKRFLAIVVGEDQQAVLDLAQNVDDVDLTFAFVTNMSDEVDPHVEWNKDDLAVLYLNFMTKLGDLPGGLQLLEDYMSPEDVNVHLLLSLYQFIQEWTKTNSVSPNQESQLEYIQGNLLEQSISQLLGPPINQEPELGVDSDTRRVIQPQQVLNKLFNRVIRTIYPEYETLFISANYDTFLDDYETLLIGKNLDLQISQKRGDKNITEDSEKLAEAIGVSSKATAKTRYTSVLDSLVDVKNWEGQDRTIQLRLHPLEKKLRTIIEERNEDGEHLRYKEAYDIAAAGGYRKEEVDWALCFLEERQYINKYPEQGYVELDEVVVDYNEVYERLEAVRDDLETTISLSEVERLDRDWAEDAEEIRADLLSLEEKLSNAAKNDIEILDEVLTDISGLEQQIETELTQIETVYRERCRSKKQELNRYSTETKPRELQKSIDGAQVTFHIHLSDLQNRLTGNFETAQNRISKAAAKLQDILDENKGGQVDRVENIQGYKEALESAYDAETTFEGVREETENKAKDYKSWITLGQEMGELRTKMQAYIRSHDDASQVKSLKSELDNLMSRIMREFTNSSNNKFDVLTNSGVYRSQFEEDIAGRYRKITRADQQDFEYRKQILENTLRNGTDGQGRLRQTLSAQNPTESRQNLSAQFAKRFFENRGGIEDVSERIEQVENKIQYTQMLNQIPDDPESEPAAILRKLQDFEEVIENISQCIDDINLRNDIPLPDDDDKSEEFPKTDDELMVSIQGESIAVGSKLSDIRDAVESRLTEVKRWRSISDVPLDLQYIHDELSARQSRDVEDILTTVGEQQIDKERDLNIDEFFHDLQKLFEGSHITIEITTEHRQT